MSRRANRFRRDEKQPVNDPICPCNFAATSLNGNFRSFPVEVFGGSPKTTVRGL